jgi:hypothetical protein
LQQTAQKEKTANAATSPKSDQVFRSDCDSFALPAPAEQTQRAEA